MSTPCLQKTGMFLQARLVSQILSTSSIFNPIANVRAIMRLDKCGIYPCCDTVIGKRYN